jgi:hypothetical protein
VPDGAEGQPEGGQQEQQTQQADEFAPITSQEEFDRRLAGRLKRERDKYRDYDSLKAKADQFDLLANESMTDREREIEEARLEAFHEAMSKAVPKAVRAEFRAQAKGVLSKEQVESLLEDLDLVKYADDDGEPDEDRIARKIAAFAPKGEQKGNNTGFGQGSRRAATQKRGEAGLLEAQRRWPELRQQQASSTS